jgi:hypothetical protein
LIAFLPAEQIKKRAELKGSWVRAASSLTDDTTDFTGVFGDGVLKKFGGASVEGNVKRVSFRD